ncbi:hypothetical protein FRC12_010812, partial [Ceratobasidium sp. 428]
ASIVSMIELATGRHFLMVLSNMGRYHRLYTPYSRNPFIKKCTNCSGAQRIWKSSPRGLHSFHHLAL